MDLFAVLGTVRDSFIVTLASAFVECLLLAMFIHAVTRGHRVYTLAALGMSASLLGRMSEGFMASGPNNILKIAGLVVAALVVTLDIVTEEVEPNEPETVS